MTPLTIGSLFSGIGGLDLGIERGLSAAGVPTRTLWQVEESPFCRKILGRHWPHAQRYADVRDITAETVHSVDILVGGFPCQDISTAGKGAGLAGERSSLFFEMARIIREVVPRIVVMENVPAIRSRGLDVVLGAMASFGYNARWGGLRASEMGAPHRRERWFCVAWLADSNGTGRQKQQPPAVAARLGHDTRRSTAHRGAGVSQSKLGREPDGTPARLDIPRRWPAPPGPQHAWEPPRTRPRQPHDRERLRALGNAVVPACAEIIGSFIASELLDLS